MDLQDIKIAASVSLPVSVGIHLLFVQSFCLFLLPVLFNLCHLWFSLLCFLHLVHSPTFPCTSFSTTYLSSWLSVLSSPLLSFLESWLCSCWFKVCLSAAEFIIMFCPVLLVIHSWNNLIPFKPVSFSNLTTNTLEGQNTVGNALWLDRLRLRLLWWMPLDCFVKKSLRNLNLFPRLGPT